jgi:hypothetical protein
VALLRPADELAHAPGSEGAWSETWGFDFGAPDGTAGFVRLRTWPERRIAWWWAYLVGPDLGLLVVRDHEVPLPHSADVLEIRADSLWGELVCESEFEHWGIGMEAFGVRLDEGSALTAAGDEIGERLAVGLDLEWEVVSPAAERANGYSQGGIVHGELLVDADRIAFDGCGIRDHSWGVPGTEPSRRIAAMLGEELAVDALVDVTGRASGWWWELGGEAVPVDAVLAEEQRGDDAPVAARWVIARKIELEVDLGSPVVIPGAGLTRAPGVVTTPDDRHGTTWLEWSTG